MKESANETRPPAPNNTPVAVFDWVGLRDETMTSPTKRALLLRAEFLARQNQSIMQTVEKILKASNKPRNRSSSISSAGTGVTESTEGEELTHADGMADPQIVEAFDALNDPIDNMNSALTEAHETFVGDTNLCQAHYRRVKGRHDVPRLHRVSIYRQ
ncbi:hypothetical protein ACHAPO_001423 [Fusarium lateritium]